MRFIRSEEFLAPKAWGALPIATMNGATVRLHCWTDEPYQRHVNDGEEVFAVMDGRVCMKYRLDGVEDERMLEVGDIFHATEGCEHVAHPVSVARILLIEREGSV